VTVTLVDDELVAIGRVAPRHAGETALEVRRTLPGPFAPAKDIAAMA